MLARTIKSTVPYSRGRGRRSVPRFACFFYVSHIVHGLC